MRYKGKKVINMETEIGSRGYTITLKTFPQHFLEKLRKKLN